MQGYFCEKTSGNQTKGYRKFVSYNYETLAESALKVSLGSRSFFGRGYNLGGFFCSFFAAALAFGLVALTVTVTIAFTIAIAIAAALAGA